MPDEPTSTQNDQRANMQLSLAAERTLLAWIRTGLSMMGFGFVVARFGLFLREVAAAQKLPTKGSVHLSIWLGTALVAVGVTALIASARTHLAFLRRLQQGIIEPETKGSLGAMIGIVLAALGIAMVAYLVLLAITG
jgi:putative membrane protein